MSAPKSKVAARDASVKQITELLQARRMTTQEMSQVVAIPKGTLWDHLVYMHQVLKIARPTGEFRQRSPVWELGADPALPAPEYRECIATTKRDPLVAALFGPAHQ